MDDRLFRLSVARDPHCRCFCHAIDPHSSLCYNLCCNRLIIITFREDTVVSTGIHEQAEQSIVGTITNSFLLPHKTQQRRTGPWRKNFQRLEDVPTAIGTSRSRSGTITRKR